MDSTSDLSRWKKKNRKLEDSTIEIKQSEAQKRKNVEEKRTHFKGFVGFHQVFQHTHFFWNCRRRIERGRNNIEEIMAENSPN